MPAFYPLRASTLPLRYDDLSTKRGYSGEDPYEICDKSKPTSVVYSTLFRRSVFESFIQIPPFLPLSRSFAQITSLFVPYYFLYNRLSDPYLFSLNLERSTLRITRRKPSKDPQRAFSPSPLPIGISHAALSYSLAAVKFFCA